MKRPLFMALIVSVGASACSDKRNFTGDADKTSSPFQEQTYLTLVGFTGSIVKREKRFSGYSKTAGRISLIDPSTETEHWGRQIDGSYDLTVPLPDYSGVAVLAGQALRLLLVDGSERSFTPVEFPIGYSARSSDSATYAFVSQDGQSLRIIHQLSSGAWQEETFASPFVVPPNFSTPPGSEPPQGVALVSGDGNRLIYFRPADGSYAYYTSDVVGGPIAATPKRKCQGEANAADAPARFRALAFDDLSSLAIQGDRLGVVSVFDPAAPCVAQADRPTQNLGDDRPVIDITVSSQGKVAVTQVGGRLHNLNVAAGGIEGLKTIEGVCNYPLGALPVGPDGMALVCVDAAGVDSVEEQAAAPATVSYQTVSVQLVSLVSGLPIFQRGLDVEDTAGAALDPELSRVLILKDSSIGILNVLDLATGEQHSKKGLFLGGILD